MPTTRRAAKKAAYPPGPTPKPKGRKAKVVEESEHEPSGSSGSRGSSAKSGNSGKAGPSAPPKQANPKSPPRQLPLEPFVPSGQQPEIFDFIEYVKYYTRIELDKDYNNVYGYAVEEPVKYEMSKVEPHLKIRTKHLVEKLKLHASFVSRSRLEMYREVFNRNPCPPVETGLKDLVIKTLIDSIAMFISTDSTMINLGNILSVDPRDSRVQALYNVLFEFVKTKMNSLYDMLKSYQIDIPQFHAIIKKVYDGKEPEKFQELRNIYGYMMNNILKIFVDEVHSMKQTAYSSIDNLVECALTDEEHAKFIEKVSFTPQDVFQLLLIGCARPFVENFDKLTNTYHYNEEGKAITNLEHAANLWMLGKPLDVLLDEIRKEYKIIPYLRDGLNDMYSQIVWFDAHDGYQDGYWFVNEPQTGVPQIKIDFDNLLAEKLSKVWVKLVTKVRSDLIELSKGAPLTNIFDTIFKNISSIMHMGIPESSAVSTNPLVKAFNSTVIQNLINEVLVSQYTMNGGSPLRRYVMTSPSRTLVSQRNAKVNLDKLADSLNRDILKKEKTDKNKIPYAVAVHALKDLVKQLSGSKNESKSRSSPRATRVTI